VGIFSFGIFYAQIVFIALTIWALLLISWVSFDAARDALRENANNEQNFTKLERILLFPILVV
jgi:ABC-type transport system involved in Fe-S cluster assembly fused permease/ATPase subunit